MPRASTRPRKSTTKRNVDKPKGPTRMKTGCYTCRIRRKKCDEEKDNQGSCKACAHLHVQCLGFGAKRPDFLKDPHYVTRLRNQISDFTRHHGMQRGGASATHDSAADPPFLMLHDPSLSPSSSSSGSPYSRRMEVSPGPSDSESPPDYYDEVNSSDSDVTPLFVSNEHEGRLVRSSRSPEHEYYTLDQESLMPNVHNMLTPNSRPNFVDYMNDILIPQFPNISHTLHVPSALQFSEGLDDIMSHYMNHISQLQYPFAEDQERFTLFEGVSRSVAARESIRLLSDVFKHHHPDRRQHNNRRFLSSNPRDYEAIVSYGSTLEDKANAALLLISCFLFDGGRGAWEGSLNVGYEFIKALRTRPQATLDPGSLYADPFERFLVTTTMRFDVLGSITTMAQPKCIDAVRETCRPRIQIVNGFRFAEPSNISMFESHMACENSVVWAIAETSVLACKKEMQLKQCTLNMAELQAEANVIATLLEQSNGLDPTANLDLTRWQTAHVFRLSALLYIQSVLWDDRPGVQEIVNQVGKIQDAFRNIEANNVNDQKTVDRIVRSSVFPIFMCGSLCGTVEQFEYFAGLLRRQEGAGNCGPAEDMLRQLRPLPLAVRSPVPWRQLLNSEKMLLV